MPLLVRSENSNANGFQCTRHNFKNQIELVDLIEIGHLFDLFLIKDPIIFLMRLTPVNQLVHDPTDKSN